MKRTKEKVERQQFEEEGEEYFESGLTECMKKDSDRFIIEPSYAFCEKLIDGRVSYQGMNPEIEKLMEAEQARERAILEVNKETEVSDEQMAEHFKNFRRNQKRGYKYDRQQENNHKDGEILVKKRKFLKPRD